MRLRLATTRDLHRLTEITTTSLIDDPTYDYMWPKRKAYPEDNFFWLQLKLERHLYDPKSTFLVVEIDDHEDGRDLVKCSGPAATIISYGIWERFGCNKAARQRLAANDSWRNTVDGRSFPGTQLRNACFSIPLRRAVVGKCPLFLSWNSHGPPLRVMR
jgi:hypothetical protein